MMVTARYSVEIYAMYQDQIKIKGSVSSFLIPMLSLQREHEWKAVLASLCNQMGCEVKQRSVQKAVRYCEKCVSIKPDRSHHCSVCEVCTLKMDHHW